MEDRACLRISMAEQTQGAFADLWVCFHGISCPMSMPSPSCRAAPPRASTQSTSSLLEGVVAVWKQEAIALGAHQVSVFKEDRPL